MPCANLLQRRREHHLEFCSKGMEIVQLYVHTFTNKWVEVKIQSLTSASILSTSPGMAFDGEGLSQTRSTGSGR